MQAALDAGNPDRALEIVFPAVGVVDAEVQVLRSLEPVWERLRAGVRLVPRELRTGLEAVDRLEAFDPPTSPRFTSSDRQRMRQSSRLLTKLPNCCPRHSSTGFQGSGMSPSPSTPRRSPRQSCISRRRTTVERVGRADLRAVVRDLVAAPIRGDLLPAGNPRRKVRLRFCSELIEELRIAAGRPPVAARRGDDHQRHRRERSCILGLVEARKYGFARVVGLDLCPVCRDLLPCEVSLEFGPPRHDGWIPPTPARRWRRDAVRHRAAQRSHRTRTRPARTALPRGLL